MRLLFFVRGGQYRSHSPRIDSLGTQPRYGNPLGPVQGVGYITELIARLTGRPVSESTTHDPSLPFPLGRSLYADFTHENLLIAVYSAMGLYNISSPLDPTRMDPQRRWVASRMVPFSARLVVERLACEAREPTRRDEGEQDEFVRVLVNDEVQVMPFCGSGEDGLCELEAFVRSQRYARIGGDGDFEKCFS